MICSKVEIEKEYIDIYICTQAQACWGNNGRIALCILMHGKALYNTPPIICGYVRLIFRAQTQISRTTNTDLSDLFNALSPKVYLTLLKCLA